MFLWQGIVKMSRVALVGPPNSGKTTLYNWLTHSSFKTVNYPGSTVEYALGTLKVTPHSEVFIMDTPGTYFLNGMSDDEVVTRKALFDHPESQYPDLILVVVDGSQLSRHLVLVEQVFESGFPFMVAVTMKDVLKRNKINLDLEALSRHYKVPVLTIDGSLGGGVSELSKAVQEQLQVLPLTKKQIRPPDWSSEVLSAKALQAEQLALKVVKSGSQASVYEQTSKLDKIILHPVGGIFFFVFAMVMLFSSIFWLAAPLMDLVDSGFVLASEFLKEKLGSSLYVDFLTDGIITGFGAIFVFVPQIFILFLGIGFLESTGYLARAATLIDRPLSRLGLSGRSFVPLLSGFACAVPAMLATRNLTSKRERWIANFVIPLMQCSARLPVFALLLGFIFFGKPAWQAGLAMTGVYFGSLIIGSLAAGVVNALIPQQQGNFFMMELPIYRRPRVKVLLKQCLEKTESYLKKAGPAILIFSLLIWVGTSFPRIESTPPEVSQSYLGQVGKTLEPVFEPMGVDWRVGVGLLSAFAAREVFVSSVSVIFQAGEEDQAVESLIEKLQSAEFPDGRKIFTVASSLSLLVFFMIALQCMSTVAVAYKESGSASFALGQLIVFNLIAYGLALGIYQLFS